MKKEQNHSKKVLEKERKQRLEDASWLRQGDREEIARICGYTRQAITVYIKGRSDNELIARVFNRFVEKRKQQINDDLADVFNNS